jgi:transposase
VFGLGPATRIYLAAGVTDMRKGFEGLYDQRVCKRCGKETVVIGYEESSQLDVELARYFVLVTKRERRACRSCEELGVVSAPLPHGSSRSAWRLTGSSSTLLSASTAITRPCIGRA